MFFKFEADLLVEAHRQWRFTFQPAAKMYCYMMKIKRMRGRVPGKCLVCQEVELSKWLLMDTKHFLATKCTLITIHLTGKIDPKAFTSKLQAQ